MKILIPVISIFSLISSLLATDDGEVTEIYTNKSGRKVEKIYWEDTRENYVLVSYPQNFDINKTYNVNFWFPGTSGKPGAGIEDQNDSYIGIGLSYLEKDKIPKGGYATAHWELCRNIEKAVVKRTKLKLNRRILSGVSKGGWLAFFSTFYPPNELHGVAIIAAGQLRGDELPIERNAEHLAVFVGTGETDSNYPHAQMSIAFFRKSKIASLCYEEWLREGHVSMISPRVNEWLDVQAKRGESSKSLSDYCGKVIGEKFAKIKTLEDVRSQYIALRHLMRSPCMKYTPKEISNEVKSFGRDVSKSEDLQPWLKEFEKFRGIVSKETEKLRNRGTGVVNNAVFVEAYKKITLETKYPDIAHRAVYAYLRTLKNHTINTLRKKYLAETNHAELSKKFHDFQIQLHNSSVVTQEQMNKLESMGAEVNDMGGDASMKAFYDVEWHNKFEIDPKMQKMLDQSQKNKMPQEIYSGLGF